MNINLHRLQYSFRRLGSGLFLNQIWRMNRVPLLPSYVDLAVEESCLLRCKHCHIWKIKKYRNAINLSQQKQILKELKKWLGFGAAINFSGGEPFMNSNTIPLIKYADQLGFYTSTNSNGFLINKIKAKEIVKSGLSHLAISLDFPDAERHNYFRGRDLVYEKALQAIKFLKRFAEDRWMKIEINTIIMKQNLSDLNKMVKLAEDLEIDGITFQPIYETFAVAKHDPRWYRASQFWPKDSEKVVKAIDKLIKMKHSGCKIGNSEKQLQTYKEYFTDYGNFVKNNLCYVGVTNFTIDRFGDVRLCWFFEPIANILKTKPHEIWNNTEAWKIREKCRNCNRGCRVLLCNSPFTAKEIIVNVLKKLIR